MSEKWSGLDARKFVDGVAEARVRELETERDELRAALEFYADGTNYDGFSPVTRPFDERFAVPDRGNVARAALHPAPTDEDKPS